MLTVTIGGVDRSSNIDAKSLRITNVLTDQVDTCKFTFWTTNRSDKPIEGQIINVTDGAERVFAGQVVNAPEVKDVTEYVYDVECVDYQRKLDKHLVVQKYENMYAGDIVKDIAAKYCSAFTVANVEQGQFVEYIPFNYKFPSECFKELAKMTAFNWYVDYEKDIHFFDQYTNLAPFNIDDASEVFWDLEIELDISQLRNRVYFRGGTYKSNPFEETKPGGQEVWLLGYKPHDMSITVNGNPETVGIENLHDPADFDFLMNYSEKHVIPGRLTTTSSDTILFSYRYDVPVLTVQDDTESIERVKQLEGGDGIYEHVIVNKEVESKSLARQLSQADLNQYSNPIVSGKFTTMRQGLRSGQLIHIRQTERDLDDDYLIREVTMRWITEDTYKYDVEVATKLKGIDDLLIELFGENRQIEVREDEVLDKLLVLRDTANFADNLTISSNTPESRVGYALLGYSEVS